jgi:hypothetical protein
MTSALTPEMLMPANRHICGEVGGVFGAVGWREGRGFQGGRGPGEGQSPVPEPPANQKEAANRQPAGKDGRHTAGRKGIQNKNSSRKHWQTALANSRKGIGKRHQQTPPANSAGKHWQQRLGPTL